MAYKVYSCENPGQLQIMNLEEMEYPNVAAQF